MKGRRFVVLVLFLVAPLDAFYLATRIKVNRLIEIYDHRGMLPRREPAPVGSLSINRYRRRRSPYELVLGAISRAGSVVGIVGRVYRGRASKMRLLAASSSYPGLSIARPGELFMPESESV